MVFGFAWRAEMKSLELMTPNRPNLGFVVEYFNLSRLVARRCADNIFREQ